jgi:hypothetical protein
MHHDAYRGIFLGRCPRAAHPSVTVGIHCERGYEVITAGVIDKPFLQEGAVLGPNFTPKYSAARVDGALGLVAGEEAVAVLINAKRTPALAGA